MAKKIIILDNDQNVKVVKESKYRYSKNHRYLLFKPDIPNMRAHIMVRPSPLHHFTRCEVKYGLQYVEMDLMDDMYIYDDVIDKEQTFTSLYEVVEFIHSIHRLEYMSKILNDIAETDRMTCRYFALAYFQMKVYLNEEVIFDIDNTFKLVPFWKKKPTNILTKRYKKFFSDLEPFVYIDMIDDGNIIIIDDNSWEFHDGSGIPENDNLFIIMPLKEIKMVGIGDSLLYRTLDHVIVYNMACYVVLSNHPELHVKHNRENIDTCHIMLSDEVFEKLYFYESEDSAACIMDAIEGIYLIDHMYDILYHTLYFPHGFTNREFICLFKLEIQLMHPDDPMDHAAFKFDIRSDDILNNLSLYEMLREYISGGTTKTILTNRNRMFEMGM